MNSLIVLLAASSVGVDYGWQPNQDGEIEYIIQIEPLLLDSLRAGTDITSRIDPRVHGVRRFRIRVGNEPPPRYGATPPPTEPGNQPPEKVADGAGTTSRNAVGVDANIPSVDAGEVRTEQPINAKLQPPPLISPDRLNTGGGAFSFEPGGQDSAAEQGGSGNRSYVPLKDAPTDSGLGSPVPDPDGATWQPSLEVDSHLDPQPRKLEPAPTSEPLASQQASYNKVLMEQGGTEVPSPSDISIPPEEEPSRPWKTLVLTCLLLFASIGLNVYLGWIARGIYVRYRTLTLEAHGQQTATT